MTFDKKVAVGGFAALTCWACLTKKTMATDNYTIHTFEDFPVGTPVKIISKFVDFYFFFGETGKVIRNTGKYLGIRVEFDKPRYFTDGYIQRDFNFEPKNLEPLT